MKLLGIISLHHSPAEASPNTSPCPCCIIYRLGKIFSHTNMELRQIISLHLRKRQCVCVCVCARVTACRASLRLENEVAD